MLHKLKLTLRHKQHFRWVGWSNNRGRNQLSKNTLGIGFHRWISFRCFNSIYKLDSLYTAVCEYYILCRQCICWRQVRLSQPQIMPLSICLSIFWSRFSGYSHPPPPKKKKNGQWSGFSLWVKQWNCVRIKRQLATRSTQAHRKSVCTKFDINPWAWPSTCTAYQISCVFWRELHTCFYKEKI